MYIELPSSMHRTLYKPALKPQPDLQKCDMAAKPEAFTQLPVWTGPVVFATVLMHAWFTFTGCITIALSHAFAIGALGRPPIAHCGRWSDTSLGCRLPPTSSVRRRIGTHTPLQVPAILNYLYALDPLLNRSGPALAFGSSY